MEKTIIEDVSEILETFNLEEIKDLLKKQVDLTENIGTNMTDYSCLFISVIRVLLRQKKILKK